MKLKRGIRVTVFLLLVVLLLVCLCKLFKMDKGNAESRLALYKSMPEGTVDAVYIGSSGVDRYWNAAQAYEEYGMTVLPICCDGNPPWLIKSLVVEAVNAQDPQLLIIDIRGFVEDMEDFSLANVARTINMLPLFSWNHLESAVKTSSILLESGYEGYSWDDIYYFLPFIQFHNKWSDEGYSVSQMTEAKAASYLGMYIASNSVKTPTKKYLKRLKDNYYTDERESLNPYIEDSLYELMDYLRTLDCEILFVDNPHYLIDDESRRTNTVFDIFDEEGFNYVQYDIAYMEENYGMKVAEDFYNSGHTNYYGAKKYTACLSKYLDENYDLPDHRDGSAPAFDGVYEAIEKKIAALEEKNK